MRLSCCTFAIVLCLTSAPALAQSSSLQEKILENPLAHFGTAIKLAAEAVQDVSSKRRGGVFVIDSCNYGAPLEQDFFYHYHHLARWYVHTIRLLRAAGYPATVYRPPLQNIVRAQLREMIWRHRAGLDWDINGVRTPALPFERQLADSMNAYRNQTDAALARAELWGDRCGGDYIGFVKLRSLPDGATIRLIREFYYKFCQLSGIDPLSSQYDKWSVVTSERNVPGGIYYYRASWPNGSTECARIEFDGASPSEDDKIVTIKQSGEGCAK